MAMNASKIAHVHKPLYETYEPVLTGACMSWRARGTMLPRRQFLKLMKQLLQRLQGGKRELAGKWLQAYGKSVAPTEPIQATADQCKTR